MVVEFTAPVFVTNDETAPLQDMGVKPKYADCNLDDMTFYKVDALRPIEDDFGDYNYTLIYSGGLGYSVPMNIEKVKELIKNSRIV